MLLADILSIAALAAGGLALLLYVAVAGARLKERIRAWMRRRDAAILASRQDRADRTKGAVGDPTGDLMGVAATVDVVPEPTYDEPYQIVDGWGRHDIWPEPQPTLREESLPVAEVDTLAEPYIARDLVPYGLGLVHAGCLAARRDHATDHICGDCGRRMAVAS